MRGSQRSLQLDKGNSQLQLKITQVGFFEKWRGASSRQSLTTHAEKLCCTSIGPETWPQISLV
jgi:hypothetical protein